jgi:acyl-CoA thioesterase
MDANELAARVAYAMLGAEGTGPAWGIKIEAAREGYARVSMQIRPDMLNGHGIAHGGMIFALADTAFAYVCNGSNHASVAAQASIVFLGKAEEGELLVAEAEEVAREGRAGATRVSVKTSDGRPIAEFTGYSRTLGGAVVDI